MRGSTYLLLVGAGYVVLQILGLDLGFNLWVFMLWVSGVNLFLGLSCFHSPRLSDEVVGGACVVATFLSFLLIVYVGADPSQVATTPDLLRWLLIVFATAISLAYCSWIMSDGQDVQSSVVDTVTLVTVAVVLILTGILDLLIYAVFEFADAVRELDDTPFGEVIPEEAIPEGDKPTSDVDTEMVARVMALLVCTAFFGAVFRLMTLRVARGQRDLD